MKKHSEPNRLGLKKKKTILLFSVFLTLIGAGFFIPSPVVEVESITVRRLPDEVWTVINDLENYGKWWPEAPEVMPGEHKTSATSDTWVVRPRNSPDTETISISYYDRPRKLIRTLEGTKGQKTWTFHLEAVGEETVLSIRESGTLSESLFKNLAKGVGMDTPLSSYTTHLAALLSN